MLPLRDEIKADCFFVFTVTLADIQCVTVNRTHKPTGKATNMHINTPWGRSDHEREIAPGILEVSTPSHGGLYLDAQRWQELTRSFAFKPFAGPQWLEEDCDFVFAVIRWPEFFDPDTVHSCVRTVQAPFVAGYAGQFDNYGGARAWLEEPAGHPARLIAAVFASQVKDLWERGSMSTEGGGWLVQFRRGDESAIALFDDYPAAHYMSTEEIQPGMARAQAMFNRKAREKLARESKAAEVDLLPAEIMPFNLVH
jgi:hypothetical protein